MFTTLRRIPRSPLFWILLFVTVYRFGLSFFYSEPKFFGDTLSYITASQNLTSLRHGDVDVLRPPVYPAFIAVHRMIFGEEHLLEWIVRTQQLISWLSVIALYYTGMNLFKNKILVILATLCFALNTGVSYFNVSILSESPAVSGIIFLMALLISYLRHPTFLKAFLLGITVFLLIMLRPAFLVFLPVFLLFWGCRLLFVRKMRKKDAMGLVTTLAGLFLVLGYCHLNSKKCGVFTLTVASPNNQFVCMLQSGLYQKDNTEISCRTQSAMEEYRKQYWYITDAEPNWLLLADGIGFDDPINFRDRVWAREGFHVSTEQKNIYVTQMIKKNKIAYAEYLLKKTVMLGLNTGRFIKFAFVYALILLDFFVILLFMKRSPVNQTLFLTVLWMIVTGGFVTAIVGSHAEYERLVFPVSSLVILMFFSVIDHFTRWQFVHDEISGRRKITVDILLQK
ncbi:MAG: hypothetical protein LBQ54_03175 [Planctomycetaceae bacterium]|jgi:4-amino-4-deoxy-L-arabinose transferase-like glycosyltransferase|nr:hypothetical protein [Planctomycetaceae bacterium]